MAKQNRRQHSSPFLLRIREFTAVTVAVTGLIVAVEHAYSCFQSFWITGGAAQGLGAGIRRLMTSPSRLELNVSAERFADNPQDAAIRLAVVAADLSKEGNRFVTLSRRDDEFIQAAAIKRGWELEFRAPFLERSRTIPVIFACGGPVGREVVIKALQLYRADEDTWTTLCSWRRQTF